MVRQRTVAFVDLLKLANRIGAMAGVAPHFLALHEKVSPVVDARVYSEQPAPWFVGRLRHPSKVSGELYTKRLKIANFVMGILRKASTGIIRSQRARTKWRLSLLLTQIYIDIVSADSTV